MNIQGVTKNNIWFTGPSYSSFPILASTKDGGKSWNVIPETALPKSILTTSL